MKPTHVSHAGEQEKLLERQKDIQRRSKKLKKREERLDQTNAATKGLRKLKAEGFFDVVMYAELGNRMNRFVEFFVRRLSSYKDSFLEIWRKLDDLPNRMKLTTREAAKFQREALLKELQCAFGEESNWIEEDEPGRRFRR